MTLVERMRAWLTAEPAVELPAYPFISATALSLEEQISAEIARIKAYDDTYGIPPKLTLDIWRDGLSVDAVLERVKQKAREAQ